MMPLEERESDGVPQWLFNDAIIDNHDRQISERRPYSTSDGNRAVPDRKEPRTEYKTSLKHIYTFDKVRD